MRRPNPQAKNRRTVPIPPELRESLRAARERIYEEARDPDLYLDYDDAIQEGAICGGRIGTQDRPYVFT